MRLKVQQATSEDVYRDIVRIPAVHRRDRSGKEVPEGAVCKVTTRKRSTYGIARGMLDASEAVMKLDVKLRDALGLDIGEEADVELQTAGFLGQFLWAWRASDPAYRVSARLAVLSLILGVIGLILGGFPFLKGMGK